MDDDEVFEGRIELAHYAAKPIRHAPVHWAIKDDDGNTLHAGALLRCSAQSGELVSLGTIRLPLGECRKATRLTINVTVGDIAANSWRIWVYPNKPVVRSQGVTLTDSLSEALQRLNRGEKVLCVSRRRRPADRC